MQYRQSENGVGNYYRCPTVSRNVMNCDPQMAKNAAFIITHPLQTMYSASVPAFAHCGHRMGVNQTLLNGRGQFGLENPFKILGVAPRKFGLKWGIFWQPSSVLQQEGNLATMITGVPRHQKDIKLAVASRRVALSGNTSLIGTCSSYTSYCVTATVARLSAWQLCGSRHHHRT